LNLSVALAAKEARATAFSTPTAGVLAGRNGQALPRLAPNRRERSANPLPPYV
jgi:hypothetical protein